MKGLRELTSKYLPEVKGEYEFASAMEFVLDGLHQNSKIAKEEMDHGISYRDMVGSILGNQGRVFEEE